MKNALVFFVNFHQCRCFSVKRISPKMLCHFRHQKQIFDRIFLTFEFKIPFIMEQVELIPVQLKIKQR